MLRDYLFPFGDLNRMDSASLYEFIHGGPAHADDFGGFFEAERQERQGFLGKGRRKWLFMASHALISIATSGAGVFR